MARLPVPQSTPKLPQQVFTAESQGAAPARVKAERGALIQQAGVQIGQKLEERQTQREISKLNAEFAKAQAELTVGWQETLRTADPNDPDVAERFRNDTVAPRVEALRDFAKTRESKAYYDRAAAGLGAGFLVTTSAGQANLREVAAVQNWNTMLNQMGDAVTADPLSFDSTLTMVDIQLDGLIQAEGLSSEKGEVLKTNARSTLAVGAAMGLIDKNPTIGREAVESGEYSEYIDAKDKQQLLNYADTQQRALEAAEEKRRKRIAGQAQVGYMKEAIAVDGTVNVESIPALQGRIVRDPALQQDPESLRAMTNYLSALADDEKSGAKFGKTNPAVYSNIMSRATLPPGDPRRPTRNEVLFLANNGLSTADANFIADKVIGQEGSVREQIGNEFRASSLKAAAARLTGSSALELAEDPGLVENYNRFLQFARLTEVDMLEQGKTPAEIWASDGPIMGRVQEFDRRLTLQEQTRALQDQLNAAPSGEPPRFEGQDPSAFDLGGKKPVSSAPQLRTGPELGATYKGKALRDLSPAEMDAWLKENQ